LGVNNARPTIRACIMLGRIVAARNGAVAAGDPAFLDLCHDVLNADCVKVTRDGQAAGLERLDEIIAKRCPPAPRLVRRSDGKARSDPPRNRNHAKAAGKERGWDRGT
ncbi:MAG: hypothetical protein HY770_03630, partial [Chitinivibrionia bacterium]|nr:hypothetical protein [Chitinivibrionia bacterium]